VKADPISVGKVLSENHRFIVPIYQRTYAWSEKNQLEPWFDQIEAKAQERITKGKVDFPHYMGSLLVIPEAEAAFGRVQAFDVVDGQQRLMTFHLCFAALREVARAWAFDDLAKKLETLLLHGDDGPIADQKSDRYKLQPSAYDRTIFRDLLASNRDGIKQAYSQFFYKNGKIEMAPAVPEVCSPAQRLTGRPNYMVAEIAERDRLIHTLANLSLLTPPGNSSAGNASFEMKKTRLRDSLLRMSAQRLADLAIRVWPAPESPAAKRSPSPTVKRCRFPNAIITFKDPNARPPLWRGKRAAAYDLILGGETVAEWLAAVAAANLDNVGFDFLRFYARNGFITVRRVNADGALGDSVIEAQPAPVN
jgi:hypothetical protein